MKLAFDNLISFHAVVTCGSFSAGARKLGKSQSTVSGAVKSLEGMLGYRLIDRESQQIGLTEQGKKLYQLVSPLVNKYRDLNHVAESLMHCQSLRLRLGVDPLVFSPKVRLTLIALCDTFPELALTIVTMPSHMLVDCIDRHEIDIAIGNPYHRTTRNFNIDELFCVHCHWVTHPQQLKVSKPYKSRLLLLDGHEYILNLSNVANNLVWVLDDIRLMIELCIAQKGIAFVPQHALEQNPYAEILTLYPNETGLFSKQIYASLIWPLHTEYSKYNQWLHDRLKGNIPHV